MRLHSVSVSRIRISPELLSCNNITSTIVSSFYCYTPGMNFRNKMCNMVLPTVCARDAHERYTHFQASKPHVCPECGIECGSNIKVFRKHLSQVYLMILTFIKLKYLLLFSVMKIYRARSLCLFLNKVLIL